MSLPPSSFPKAQLFKSNVVLHPLGGDFRYVTPVETHAMLDSYTLMMNYFAAHPELGIDMKFGTLSDYFGLLQLRATTDTYQPMVAEFFPYCDRADHYWAGYFTTRPAFKYVASGSGKNTHGILYILGRHFLGEFRDCWKRICGQQSWLAVWPAATLASLLRCEAGLWRNSPKFGRPLVSLCTTTPSPARRRSTS